MYFCNIKYVFLKSLIRDSNFEITGKNLNSSILFHLESGIFDLLKFNFFEYFYIYYIII